jgi:predicted alpha/beta-fold hydrolase
MAYSLETYCASQEVADWSLLPASTQAFLQKLSMSSVHPFCQDPGRILAATDIPPMGPLAMPWNDEDTWESLVTFIYMYLPPLFALVDSWFRLLSGVVAPVALLYLVWNKQCGTPIKDSRRVSKVVLIAAVCSLLIMTDSMYVYEYGAHYGVTMFVASIVLGFKACQRLGLRIIAALLSLLLLTAILLTWDGFMDTTDSGLTIEPGLYYNADNALVNKTVSLWPERLRTYTREFGATPWMQTGDARTGLPYFFNRRVPVTKFIRVHLPVEDGEVLILGITFPEQGHNPAKPIYMVLHGVNGGTTEDYLRDLAWRRTRANSTVIVMVSRGLMDAPLKSWNIFHGARWSDAHETALAIRSAMEPGQMLAGIGYSMGAIVLNNYVASSGTDCVLDSAFSISGALECRHEQNFTRPKHLWQPMIVSHLRSDQHIAKWGQRMKAKLSHSDWVGMLRATNVVDLDQYIAVAYLQEWDNITHFYSKMGALGDISIEDLNRLVPAEVPEAKIHNVSVPLLVLHAYDDPISTWRTNVANNGFMRPGHLIKTGNGNLMLLLTATGGHVGWPLGWFPFSRNWEFMSEAAASFVEAVGQAKTELNLVD